VSLVDEVKDMVLGLQLSQDWSAAACKSESGVLTDFFFSSEVADIARAKAICLRCPLKHGCLADALARREPCGVWGGELLVDGRVIAKKRGRGRPRKADSSALPLSVVA
jgi:WhiB family redox-sensing transcriptional regulator